MRKSAKAPFLLVAAVALALGGCNSATSSSSASGKPSTGSPASSEATPANKTVTMLVYSSFGYKKIAEEFEADTGYKLQVLKKGHVGEMVNQIILTKNNPLGDVVYAVDSAYGPRLITEDAVSPSGISDLPKALSKYSDQPATMIPVDFADVCVNYDLSYFAKHNLAVPQNLADLVKPEYKNLFATENPLKSSPGLNFMLASIASYGENGWVDYWKKLQANGLRIDAGWSEAYNTSFTKGSSHTGTYPLVTSYSNTPIRSIDQATGKPTTGYIPGTCFREVEYAAMIKGAKNPQGARVLIKWLLSKKAQESISKAALVYPVIPEYVSDAVKKNGLMPPASHPMTLGLQKTGENLKKWQQTFSSQILG